MKRKTYLFLVIFLLLTSFSLSQGLKDIKISLEEKQIKDLSPSGVTLVFYINIKNSSSKPYFLSRYHYRFVVNQKEYFRLQTSPEEGIEINAPGKTLIALPVKINYELLFQIADELRQEDKALCYLMGELRFSDGRKDKGGVPFAFSGEFPIFREPDIEFVALKSNDLTIGGADLNFEVKFTNRNGFEMLLDRISYTLKFGGHPINEGTIAGDKSIESHGEKIFSILLLLNFFEVGKDVYSVLQQPSTFCNFSGEIEVRTIWGKIKIPFVKSGTIPITNGV